MGLQKMAAVGGPVGLADDGMGMDLRFAALVEGDVADQRQHLHLLANRDPSVLLSIGQEVADGHVAERPDRREAAGRQVMRPGERRQIRRDLISFVEDESEGLGGRIL